MTHRLTPFWRRVLWAVAVGLVIRVIYILWLHRAGDFMIGDAKIYHGEGKVIADGRGWIDPYFFETTGYVRQLAMHPPSYPAYLAFWSWLGIRSPLGHQLASLPIGLTTIVLCALAGRRIWGERVGVLAAALAAVHASFWSWDGMILQEPLAILASLLLILAFHRLLGGLERRSLMLAGLASGFAPLVRAEHLAGVGLLALVVLFHHGWRKAFVPMLIPGVIAVVMMAPWTIYNMGRFEEPSTLSNGFGITLSSTHCPALDGEMLGYWSPACAGEAVKATVDEWERLNPGTPELPVASTVEEYQRVRAAGGKILAPAQAVMRFTELDESERDSMLRARTIEWIKANPRYEMRAVPARIGRVLGIYHPLQQIALDTIPDGRKRPIAVTAWLGYYALAPFAVAGALGLWRRRKATALVVVMPLVAVLITVSMTFGNTRYRAIAEPTFVLFAAASLTQVRLWLLRVWRAPANG